MSFEVLAHLIHAACTDPNHQGVSFGWHGGEPMVLPVRFYEMALALQARYRRPGQVVQNRLQTNATLVDDKWAKFLAREKFGVGVSIDGQRPKHDLARVGVDGSGSFDRVLEGLERLRFHGVSPGILLTVDRDTVERGAESTLSFLLAIGARSIGFNPVQPSDHLPAGDVGDQYLTRAEMNSFLIDMHQCWVALGDPELRIRELHSLVGRIGGGDHATCILAGDCTSMFYAVEPNGDIANCDRFFGHGHYSFGSILRSDFSQIRQSLRLLERRASDSALADRRRDCEHFDVCSGGCPQQTGLEERHDPGYDVGCCGRGPLINYLTDHGERPRQLGVPVTLSAR